MSSEVSSSSYSDSTTMVVSEKDSQLFRKPLRPVRKRKKVLDEEKYSASLETIIVRDFYPDVQRLEIQTQFLSALEKNDVEKLREISLKYGAQGSTPDIYKSPAQFYSPNIEGTSANITTTQSYSNPEPEDEIKKAITNKSLDQFLNENTSEDNASFESILKENEKRFFEKYAWLYDQEKEFRKRSEAHLALRSMECQAIGDVERSSRLESWTYENKNSLMYVPEGVEKSVSEKLKVKHPQEIVHLNTRFKDGEADVVKVKHSMNEVAQQKLVNCIGKIGHDGKELKANETPAVNGFKFMATPSPAPGVSESPLMTWGEIDGTPFRLDGGDTPVISSDGPKFRIAQVPARDIIAHQLAEKVGISMRNKHKKAIDSVTSQLVSPSPKFGHSRTEKLSHLSPAARRLASGKLGLRMGETKSSLQASYTPSPRTASVKTSNFTPQSSKLNTPEQSHDSRKASSITDNLLSLPKRRKNAKDFF